MDTQGGWGKFDNNKAGATYGTGYCDSTCDRSNRFIEGEGNVDGWTPSVANPTDGKGKYGNCCNEFKIFEGNSISTSMSAHTCQYWVRFKCEGAKCGEGDDKASGICDRDGCDLNPYRHGNKTFYGPGSEFTIDTSQKFTVVTQFLTKQNKAGGTVNEVKRIYIQGDKVLEAPNTAIDGMST